MFNMKQESFRSLTKNWQWMSRCHFIRTYRRMASVKNSKSVTHYIRREIQLKGKLHTRANTRHLTSDTVYYLPLTFQAETPISVSSDSTAGRHCAKNSKKSWTGITSSSSTITCSWNQNTYIKPSTVKICIAPWKVASCSIQRSPHNLYVRRSKESCDEVSFQSRLQDWVADTRTNRVVFQVSHAGCRRTT